MILAEIYHEIKALAPPELAKEGDHIGFLIGRPDRTVTKVLCALDITREAVEEAEAFGAQLILAHHPLFYDSLTELRPGCPEQELALMLAEMQIAAVCMHTNLDAAEGGVNETLARLMGVADVKPLSADRCSWIGELPVPSTVEAFAGQAKELLNSGSVCYTGTRPVSRVAVASGSGWSCFSDVLYAKADTFLTGEVKHSGFLEARHWGINVIECGHFATENVVFRSLIPALQARAQDVEFRLSQRQGEPYQCL